MIEIVKSVFAPHEINEPKTILSPDHQIFTLVAAFVDSENNDPKTYNRQQTLIKQVSLFSAVITQIVATQHKVF
jgi:hypothetical protein